MSIAAMNSALEFVERICGDLCNAEYNPCEARDIADTLRAAIEAAQTVAKCDHIPVTTFGGDFCIKCNEPMDSNEYPKPAPAGMVLVGYMDGRGRFFCADDPQMKANHTGMRECYAPKVPK